MNEKDREKKREEGLVALGWLAASVIFFVITLIAWLIWRTKIAVFILAIGTLLLIIFIILFLLWRHSLTKK